MTSSPLGKILLSIDSFGSSDSKRGATLNKTKFAGTLSVILLGFGPAIWVSQAQDLAPEVLHYADLVFYNGQVLTMDQDQPPFTVMR